MFLVDININLILCIELKKYQYFQASLIFLVMSELSVKTLAYPVNTLCHCWLAWVNIPAHKITPSNFYHNCSITED